MSKKIVPIDDWLLVYPLIQDERKTDSGIVLLEGMTGDDIDVSRVRLISMSDELITDTGIPEQIVEDAILLIPKMEGLTLKIGNGIYKLVKMDRVCGFEEVNDE